MKRTKYVTVLSLLNLLAFAHTGSAGADRGQSSLHRGGQAQTHMSEKGSANTNARWTADPNHGWIRAQERHEKHSQGHDTIERRQNRQGLSGNRGTTHKQLKKH